MAGALVSHYLGIRMEELHSMDGAHYQQTVGMALALERRQAEMMETAVANAIVRAFKGR